MFPYHRCRVRAPMLYRACTSRGRKSIMTRSLPKWATQYFYTVPQLHAAGVLLSRSRLSRLQAAGQFPRPLTRLGDRAYFPKAEVDAWVRQRRAMAAEVSPERSRAEAA